MATATSPKIAESLHSHLMCPIHLDILKNPKTLPCQHVVCAECIQKWIDARGGQLFCPECHVIQPLPAEGVQGLPNNFKMASMCDLVESLMKSENEVAACEEHLKKPVAKICLHCTVPVCEDCVKSKHKTHKTIAIEEFLRQMGDPLPKLVTQAKGKLQEIFQAVEVLEKTRTELRTNHDAALKECDDQVHKWMKAITQAQVKMRSDIERVYYEKEAGLIEQLESLSSARAEINEWMAVETDSDAESSMTKSVMTAAGQQMWNKLNQLMQQSLRLTPEQNSLISLKWDAVLDSAIQKENLGSVVTKAVPTSQQSSLSVSALRAPVQSEVTVQVTLRDAVGSPVLGGDSSSLSASIQAPGGFTGYLQFECKNDSTSVCEAVFTSKYIGKYRIEAQLGGKTIKNSPLNIIATPRGQMTLDERGSLNNPHDIVKHDDNFYVADKGSGQVLIMDKEFKLVGKFFPPSGQGLHQYQPYSIACTGRTFVVSDPKNHCVFEFINSAYLQRFGQDVLKQPTGVACDKAGKVYVADCQQHCVHVFNPLREHIAVLGGPGSTRGQLKQPWFVAINSMGEVVVADFGNHRIQVINPETEEVSRLIDVHLNQKVWDVRGLDVDKNDNIYVTVRQSGNMRGWSSECVIAYSPEGVFLGNFGSGFNYVRGLTVIEDAENTIALVVDGANHRIKGFKM
ncbi:tripartite motif-containing protein 3-like [Diadema antillarum]|uniref:tripartite motif-containing protein 3-like n=1 Tax=Diadema antillarum TaxID=105358 RepID=UPI003A86C27D